MKVHELAAKIKSDQKYREDRKSRASDNNNITASLFIFSDRNGNSEIGCLCDTWPDDFSEFGLSEVIQDVL